MRLAYLHHPTTFPCSVCAQPQPVGSYSCFEIPRHLLTNPEQNSELDNAVFIGYIEELIAIKDGGNWYWSPEDDIEVKICFICHANQIRLFDEIRKELVVE